MSFNENTFMVAGTIIAIAGVGLYIWDTRGSKAATSLTSQFSSTGTGTASSSPPYSSEYAMTSQNAGKSKKHYRKQSKGKSKKHY